MPKLVLIFYFFYTWLCFLMEVASGREFSHNLENSECTLRGQNSLETKSKLLSTIFYFSTTTLKQNDSTQIRFSRFVVGMSSCFTVAWLFWEDRLLVRASRKLHLIQEKGQNKSWRSWFPTAFFSHFQDYFPHHRTKKSVGCILLCWGSY